MADAKKEDKVPDAKKEDKAPAVKLVKMTRDPEIANGKPTEAEVHPDEVDNYSRAGWVKC